MKTTLRNKQGFNYKWLTFFTTVAFALLIGAKCALSDEIYDAVLSGNLEKVKVLLKEKPDLASSKNEKGIPLMFFALRRREMLELFLANKADVNAKNSRNVTALHSAAEINDKDVAELLLANGADVGAKDIHGLTPLHTAVSHGSVEVAKMLLAHKSDVEAKAITGLTPLHLAAFDGQKELVELLLVNKADVNAKTESGETPLQMALRNGHKEVVEFLRQHGSHG